MSKRFSTITIRENNEKKSVQLGEDISQNDIKEIVVKWQSLIDILANVIHVPSGLIMKLNENNIEVFLKSNTIDNPYHVGEQAELIYGLYCESVIGIQSKLLVPNAKTDDTWAKNNPDVDINMISYLGYPVNWPNGDVFGTVCILDNKENSYSKLYEDLLYNVKLSLETDLQILSQANELENLNERLKLTNDFKTKLISIIAHDVRGSIGNLSEFLNHMVLDYHHLSNESIHSYLNSLSNNTSSVYSTLENLLAWAKSDLLSMQTNKVRLNVVEIINQVIHFVESSIRLKEQHLITEFEREDLCLFVDRNMFETILRNLLSNAIKYTPNNGYIYIRVIQLNTNVIIEVEDTGIGMTEKTKERLFSYDKDHKKSGTMGEGSTGIGLLLCNDFIRKNNGRIHVDSEENGGTKVTLTIPSCE
ncbi:MAG: HAMP domain-containing histidine kinase [Bacteroidales bacterium]|nr:HAMP domain-containing histidine kinase [Bacteroidales bacterium]